MTQISPPRPAGVPEGYEVSGMRTGFALLIGPLYDRVLPDGSWTRGFLVEEKHTNGMGNCHGGMLMAFVDMAFGHSITMAINNYWVTVRLMTDFVQSAKVGEFVEGNSEVIGREEDFLTVRGRIWVGDRTLIAGTGIFKAIGSRTGERPTARR